MKDQLDIETLFNEYYIQLHRYAFTILKDDDEAKDIVQNVFLTLWEKGDQIRIQRSVKAYLFRSIYNESINYIRKKDAQQRHYLQSVQQDATATDTAVGEEAEVWRKRIDDVLNTLPPQCREVFVKSRAEQKKYVEIASELGIAVKTVEAHMTKALKLIRQAVRVLICIVCLCVDMI